VGVVVALVQIADRVAHRRQERVAVERAGRGVVRYGGLRRNGRAVEGVLRPRPTQAKSYYHDDLVVCVLRGGFTRVEQTLLEGGRGHAVTAHRMEFPEVMRERFTAVIEHATGRPLIGS